MAVAESTLRDELPRVEPGEAAPSAAHRWAGEDLELDTWFLGYLTVLYLISMFLLTFFNTAFFNEIINALNGRPVSIAAGLRFALTKLKPIAMWSLLAGVVGIVIEKLEQQFGFFGRWIVGLIGVVNKVFQCALYIYAAEGEIPGPFDQAVLDAAWKVKKKAD